jgi:hypothetical protein
VHRPQHGAAHFSAQSSAKPLVRKDLEIMSNRIDGLSATMTVRLGSMLMVGLGLLFAALKLA